MGAEQDFEEELDLLLPEWDALGIDTTQVRRRLAEDGAVMTAKFYVHSPTGGFGEAYRRLRPGATFEGLVVRYEDLEDFDEATVAAANAKLADAAGAGTANGDDVSVDVQAWLADAEGISDDLELQDPFYEPGEARGRAAQ